MKKKTKQILLAFISMVLMIALDQWTKMIAVANWKETPKVLWKDVFELRYLENIGAAFSSMEGKTVLLLLITGLISVVLIFLYLVIPETKRWRFLRIALVLLIAGGIGNYIDRVRLGYVVDFLYFKAINFPIFNVADCYVTVGIIAIIFLVFLYYKDEEWDEVKQKLPAFMQKKKTEKDESEKNE